MPAALHHLKKRSEFLAVAGTNRRWTTPGLVLQARLRPNDAQNSDTSGVEADLHVGFTATKKIGNAVKRNRARRRLRAAVADVLRGLPTVPADLVIVARQGTIDRPYVELKTDLQVALHRLRVVR